MTVPFANDVLFDIDRTFFPGNNYIDIIIRKKMRIFEFFISTIILYRTFNHMAMT